MKIDNVNNIAIVGLGMMGASLAAALKAKSFNGKIYGYSRNENTCSELIEKNVIDYASVDLIESIKEADIIIMCLPIDLIIEKTNEIFDYLKPGSILTDIGSTKKEIVDSLDNKFKNSDKFFVGSHPICGSEKSGYQFLNDKLFEGKLTVLCSSKDVSSSVLKKIESFWKIVGSKTIYLDASLHDKKLAVTSHLPHILSSLLIDVFGKYQSDELDENIQNFCGTGFFDVSRLASGSSDIWKDIISTNSKEIIHQLEILEESVKELRELITIKDDKKIISWLKSTSELRNEIISNNGF